MKKLLAFILIVVLGPIIGGIYGIIHDQITFSISSEYFTKFKYDQFGFEPSWFGGDRQTVVVISYLATFWVGVIAGTVSAFCTVFHPTASAMLKAAVRMMITTLAVAALMGILGFIYGTLSSHDDLQWYFPEGLIDKDNFVVVGWIHNFGYAGAALGLIISVIIQFVSLSRERKRLAAVER